MCSFEEKIFQIMKKLEVFFDYTCPFCYIGLTYLKKHLPDYPNILVSWHSCEAHPHPEPRMVIEPESNSWWKSMIPTAKRAGISINTPHTPVPHSSLAIQGLAYAKEQGADIWAYHDAVYQAVFEHAQDIERIDILAECAVKSGINRDKFSAALISAAYEEIPLEENRYTYDVNRVWAVPSLICEEYRLDASEGIGIKEKDLTSFLEKITK